MKTRNPRYEEKVRDVLERAPFVQKLGIELQKVAPGTCETRMNSEPWHLQQNGFVHAGVIATLADHSAGAAAATLVDADQGVLSIEFKVNFLHPAPAGQLTCLARVLKAGKTVTVAESEVLGADGKLVAKATVTLAVVPDSTLPA